MWFKKKKEEHSELLPLLVEYIENARDLLWEDKEIEDKFREKGYPEELIEKAFKEANNLLPLKQLNERRTKMAKKKEYEEEDDEDDEEEYDEDDEDTDEDEEEPKPKKKVETRGRPKKVEEEPKKLTSEQIAGTFQQTIAAIRSIEERITNLEAALFRIKGSI